MTRSLETLDKTIATLNGSLDELRAKYSALGEQLTNTHKMLQTAVGERAALLYAQQHAAGDIDWSELLKYDFAEGNYKVAKQAVKELGADPHLTVSGYFPKTMQWALKLCFDERSAPMLPSIRAALEQLIPHVLPHEDVDGWKLIGLLDPGLSEHHSYHVGEKSGQWALLDTRHSYRNRMCYEAESLEGMLQYLQRCHSFSYES